MSVNSDEKLWEEMLSGDKRSLEKIYADHFDFLYRYGLKMADTSLVEDAIHDLFVEIWQKRNGLSKTSAIRPYLTISLKRKIVKMLKKEQRNTSIEQFQFGLEDSIEHKLISDEVNMEQHQKLQKAMTNLSSRQKEIIFLKFYSDLSYQEICDIMELNYQSARNLLARAVKQLGGAMRFLVFFIP